MTRMSKRRGRWKRGRTELYGSKIGPPEKVIGRAKL